MTKHWTSLTFAAALSTISLAASADPTTSMSSFLAAPRQCAPGSHVACSCGNGGSGTATCAPNGAGFSLCACAKVTVNLPIPILPILKVPTFRRQPARVQQREPERESEPMPGLALLIGGACTLGTGTFNVIFGAERIRKYGRDPFGIVSVSLGGTAMLIGLPLTIIGIVRYANEPKKADDKKESDKDKKATSFRFTPTADGFAIHF